MRSKGSLKPSLPCLDDPVTKLEGLGEKTRRNLLDVRACAATLDLASSIPQECPNSVTTGKPAVLCCAVLCCAVLCCAVLCCAVLCCAICISCTPCPHAGSFNQHFVLTAWISSVLQSVSL